LRFNWFEEHTGQERAATMTDLVSHGDWSGTATNSGCDPWLDAIDRRFDALDARFELFENRVVAMLHATQSELVRTIRTWLLLSQAAVIAMISVAIALVALG
jgi:hypothetical protein